MAYDHSQQRQRARLIDALKLLCVAHSCTRTLLHSFGHSCIHSFIHPSSQDCCTCVRVAHHCAVFIAILTEAYEKAKVEVFGDAVHEREEAWVGTVPFLTYVRHCITYTFAALTPGKRNIFRQLKRIGAEAGLEKSAGFTEWLAAKDEERKRTAEERGQRDKGDEVNELAELAKAARSQLVYHAQQVLTSTIHSTVDQPGTAGRQKKLLVPVKLVVGTYGLSVLGADSYTTYIYENLRQWKFDPQPHEAHEDVRMEPAGLPRRRSGRGGQFHLVLAEGGAEAELHFITDKKETAATICNAMMQNAMLEQQDTFSTSVSMKVLRLEMEQSHNLLLSMIKTVGADVKALCANSSSSSSSRSSGNDGDAAAPAAVEGGSGSSSPPAAVASAVPSPTSAAPPGVAGATMEATPTSTPTKAEAIVPPPRLGGKLPPLKKEAERGGANP